MSKASEQFNAIAAEKYLETLANKVMLFMDKKVDYFFCFHCGDNTPHERDSKAKQWICIYSFSHKSKEG